jgi:hypothetical protein
MRALSSEVGARAAQPVRMAAGRNQLSVSIRETAHGLMMQPHNSLTRSYSERGRKPRDAIVALMPLRALVGNASAKNSRRDCIRSSEVYVSAYNFNQDGGSEM